MDPDCFISTTFTLFPSKHRAKNKKSEVQRKQKFRRFNLTKSERNALKSLQNNKDIVIKNADKTQKLLYGADENTLTKLTDN